MTFSRFCRSLLNVPATAVRRYAGAVDSGADIVVADLEDALPPAEKAAGRRLVADFLGVPPPPGTRLAIRINALSEPDGLRDLLALRGYAVSSAVVLVPKVESARDVEIVERVLRPACPAAELVAIVETARGLQRAPDIARASPILRALIFGAADYSAEVGARLSWEAMAHARATVVNSARAAGIEALDAPWFGVTDEDGLRREAQRARDLGFSGKVAIHPRQLPVINKVFSPDATDLARARKLTAIGRDNGGGITVVDGVMVGKPFFAASRQLIEEFGEQPADTTPPPADREESDR